MRITIALVLFYLLAPIALIYFCKLSRSLKKIGPVVLAYALGLFIGNIGFFPTSSEKLKAILGHKTFLSQKEFLELYQSSNLPESDLLVNQIAGLQDLLIAIIIPLAIPLLLFSLNLRRWLKLAKGAVLSLILAMVSLLIAVFSAYYLFGTSINESWNVSGMLIGVYTGGTPNLAAIGTALEVSPHIFILTHTYDLIIGAVILLFLMTFAQRLFQTFLPKFIPVKKEVNEFMPADESDEMENFDRLFKQKEIPDILKALGISTVIFAIGGGLSLAVSKPIQTVTAILSITTLGLLASLIKWINKLKVSFPLGMYLIIVFSLVVSSMANLHDMFQIEFFQLFLNILTVVIGSMVIHVGLSKLFKVDADTTIIAITALTYSPPFVPAVAGALKNKDVIITGLAIGILGYAFGTYLGIAVANLLEIL